MDLQYYLGFSYMLGIGPMKFDLLVKHFGSVEKAYNAPSSALITALGISLAQKFIDFRNTFNGEKELHMMQKSDITILTREDSRFPKSLLNLSDPPICLYIKGNVNEYNFEEDLYVAVVGTRKPTYYGEFIASKFSYELAEQGFVIVSGLALGIDAIAHEAALKAKGKTIAFLGCGVNIVYPHANRLLYKKILDNDGLIISEVPPNMQVLPGLFVQRNRLISGLSKGVLVAEGLKDSGSLITARFAAQQGKDVFAAPAPITSELSEAPNILLKEGAKLVTSSKDILEEYNIVISSENKELILVSLTQEERSIYQLLSQEPYDSDELARQLQVPIYKVLTILSGLELRSLVSKNGSMYVAKVH